MRGEDDTCEFETGVEPPLSGYLKLKARLDHLESSSQAESSLHSSNVGRGPRPGHSSIVPNFLDKDKLVDQESVFGTLSHLAAVPTRALPSTNGVNSTTSGSELFPNIIATSMISKSALWTRNLSQILEALPSKAQIDVMLDFYFSQVQILRESVSFEI